MGQFGFFDADNRLTGLSAKGDPLEAIDRLVPWESFRDDIEAAVLTPETERKTAATQPSHCVLCRLAAEPGWHGSLRDGTSLGPRIDRAGP